MKAEAAMRLALSQARRAAGRTFPNPAVGAVVFRGDRVLGRGATRPPGGPHAEVLALRSATRRAGEKAVRGAALAVTLEPCCFSGRTGPCLHRLQGSPRTGARAWHPETAPRRDRGRTRRERIRMPRTSSRFFLPLRKRATLCHDETGYHPRRQNRDGHGRVALDHRRGLARLGSPHSSRERCRDDRVRDGVGR